jgi:hypothetical protein
MGEVKTPGNYLVTDVEKMTGVPVLTSSVTGSAATGDVCIILNNEEILLNSSKIIIYNLSVRLNFYLLVTSL